jgi:hypothetical protein
MLLKRNHTKICGTGSKSRYRNTNRCSGVRSKQKRRSEYFETVGIQEKNVLKKTPLPESMGQ